MPNHDEGIIYTRPPANKSFFSGAVCRDLVKELIDNQDEILAATPLPKGSVTWKVRVKLPDVLGVPVISPMELSKLKPPGRLPETRNQVRGFFPLWP